MSLALTKLSETSTKITLGWPAVAGAVGYRFQSSTTAPKWSHTFDASRRQVTFSKAEWYKVEALGVEEAGEYPSAAPPPPPTGVNYPASYFTGPLGSRNFVPPKKGAFLGTWGVGTAGVATWDTIKRDILARESAMDRKYDFIMNPYHEEYGEWQQGRMKWIYDHGSIPVTAEFNFNPLNVTQIANGQADAEIDHRADHYKSLGFDVMIRMMHEQDLPHLAYTCKGREADYVRAWRRIVDRFKARGVTNVGWWWCPMEGYDRPSANASYPGDTYVDWVGTDAYNWSFVGEDSWSTPLHPGWAEVWELFDYKHNANNEPATNRHDGYGPRKPFVIGETGTCYDSRYPEKKAAWYRNIPAAVKNMEYLCGISFFDNDVSSLEGPKTNWLVDHPSSYNNGEMLRAFADMARDPWFNTRA